MQKKKKNTTPVPGFDISSFVVIGYWWPAPTPPGGVRHWLLVIGGYWPAAPPGVRYWLLVDIGRRPPPQGSVIGYWWPRYWSARRAGRRPQGRWLGTRPAGPRLRCWPRYWSRQGSLPTRCNVINNLTNNVTNNVTNNGCLEALLVTLLVV